MVHASNPRLMNRVLDAVVHLCEGKGSTARDVLDFLRQTSKTTQRNLTMQVHRALKHAVNAGLLRHRSGRYKALFTLNPAPVKQCATENSDEKSVEGPNVYDTPQISARTSSSDKEENREKHRRRRERRRKRSRSKSRHRRRRRRSGSRKRDDAFKYSSEIRKLKYKETGESSRSPHKISNNRLGADIRSTSNSSNHKRSKGRSRDRSKEDRTYYSDLSDYSDCESRKPKVRRKSPSNQDGKCDERGKQKGRSVSRNRSPQRQQSQQLNSKHSRDEVGRTNNENIDDGRNEEADTEKDDEPNNTGSGSTL